MFMSSLPVSTKYIVRVRCLIPPITSSSYSSLLNLQDRRTIMSTTTTTTTSAGTFGFVSSTKSATSQTTCNICARLLYSFEEILLCRICHGSYHWRCVKPETISHYGENAQFICEKCNENAKITTINGTPRSSNSSGIKIKSLDSAETGYRDFAGIPTKLNSIPTKDTTVTNTIRYFEEKQQQQSKPIAQKPTKSNEFDEYRTSQTNGQYTDDNKTYYRNQQQQNNIESDEDNTTTGMFQANYQYTPLKEYAAMRTGRITNDSSIIGQENSRSVDIGHQAPSRLTESNLQYTNHDYESSVPNSVTFASPTVDTLSVHNRQTHYVSTTNLNINETPARRSQQRNDFRNSLHSSTPYISQVLENDSYSFKPSIQQQTDRCSAVGSDSGIVMANTHNQQIPNENNQVIERKLTDLVQKLGRQLETDAEKLSEKLEVKLKNLESMIHQQTYVIRRQDEVIERLKSKILKIETERDHFRDRLSVHEQREQSGNKIYTSLQTDEGQKTFDADDPQQTSYDISTNRKFSNSSSIGTEQSKPSTKKVPAPRAENRPPMINNEYDSTISKFIKNIPTNEEPHAPDNRNSLGVEHVVAVVPIVEKPPAASRLDDMIHQTNPNTLIDPSSTRVRIPEIRHVDSQTPIGTNKMQPEYATTSIHKEELINEKKSDETKSSRSSTASSSPSSSDRSEDQYTVQTGNKFADVVSPVKGGNLHRSLDSLPHTTTSESERGLKGNNKAASLEFGRKPMEHGDSGAIYVTPKQVTHPATAYQTHIKGWLRKQNRDSFFKRIERYYCVLSANTILMHKRENDTRAYKEINLKGARVLSYEDQKYGPTLELTWRARMNETKHYHLYAPNTQEAEKWKAGIQNVISALENTNSWQRYRMTQ